MAVAQAAGRCLGPSFAPARQPVVVDSRQQQRVKAVVPVCTYKSHKDFKAVVLSRPADSTFFGTTIYHKLPVEFNARNGGALSTSASAGVADECNEGTFYSSSFSSQMMVPYMAKGLGSFSGATLERSKLDLSQSTTQRQVLTEDGGGGGDIGGRNKNGGGDGGDDGGDDDDYIDGGDGDDDGDEGWRRTIVPELFDRASMEAVLQEWYRTMVDLPAGLAMAVEMGLISSSQLARFLSVNARPTIARAVSRVAPDGLSRAFIGRMMADPAFLYKLALEQAITIGSAVHWEVQQRGSRLKDEWDLALVNVLALSACNMGIMWATAPSRAFGTTFKYEWQNMLQKLPNNVFDKSYPLREFNKMKRVQGFFYKCAEMSAAGMVAGGISGALQNALLNIRRNIDPSYRPAVDVPSISTSALGYGAFQGLSCNIRYQLLGGLDRVMYQQLNNLGLVVAVTSALRVMNQRVGEPTRLAWLGIGEGYGSVYRRPSTATEKERFSLASWLRQQAQSRKAKVAQKQAAAGESTSGDTLKNSGRKQQSRYRIRRKEELSRGGRRPSLATAGSS